MAQGLPEYSTLSNRQAHETKLLNGNSCNPDLSNQGLSHTSSLIAVCGIGVRLPGGIQSPDDFWELLVNGRDARGEIPPSRYNIHGFDDSLDGKGVIKSKYGYFLDNDLSHIDASCFSMTRQELAHCDPQQRQLLEVVKEALDDAGETNYRGQPVGCYVGTFSEDWLQIGNKETQHTPGNGYIATGNGDLMLANRVSYEYDLRGPSFVVKTGCSASLVAMHEARRALQCGDASAALVAGTSIIMTPTTTATFTSQGLLAADSRCKTFDVSADGFARAEAITCVYLKTLDAALRDGNPIQAIIRASSLGSDGKTTGLLLPNGEAHEHLMRQVYAQAGLDPAETAYVECHGTGTQKGDMTETTAIGRVFGDKGVYIGSVKANVGHSEGSSGLSSLIKVILTLQHDTIPPQINFKIPNPKIPFERAGLKVPLKPEPFPADRKKRVSINSFGIGGANAHAILEAHEKPASEPPRRGQPVVFLLSANSIDSLKGQVERHETFAKLNTSVDLVDMAYTLAVRRCHMPYRSFTIWDGTSFVDANHDTKASGTPPSLTLVFSGQGAQWPQMAKDLIVTDSRFKHDLCQMDLVLQRLTHAPDWSILEELGQPAETSRVNIAALSQPLTTAVQIALFNSLARTGIKPAFVVGHSSGEIAAAYACGALSMEAAMTIAYYRGFVTKSQGQSLDGAMAAVDLGVEDAREYLEKGVRIACENSPGSTTVSGDRNKVLDLIERVKADRPDAMVRLLKVDMAYHSHHMTQLGIQYEQLLKEDLAKLDSWHGKAQVATLISTVTASVISPDTIFGPEYWRQNLIQPVRFGSAIDIVLASNPDSMFLEIGPHSTLKGPIRQVCQASPQKPFKYTSALIRGESCFKNLLSAIGRLYQEAIPLDLTDFYPNSKTLHGLPTYAWDHKESYWSESRVSRDWRHRKYAQHPLLGARVPEPPELEPQWRNMLYLSEELWLADHKVNSDIIYPFAAYIAMAGEALRQITGSAAGTQTRAGYRIRRAVASRALVISETEGHELVTTLRRRRINDHEDSSQWFEFTISSYAGNAWQKHCVGQIMAIPSEAPNVSAGRLTKLPRKVEHTRYYEYLADIGMDYGPAFRILRNITASTTVQEASGEMLVQHTPSYLLHPVAIDAIFHLVVLAKVQGLGRGIKATMVPTVIESLDIFPAAGEAVVSRGWITTSAGARGFSLDGTPVFRLSGIELAPYALEHSGIKGAADPHSAARLEWLPHADFINLAPLCKPPPSNRDKTLLTEELTLLCIIETLDKIKGVQPGRSHFSDWRRWLEGEVAHATDTERKYLDMSVEERRKQIRDRYKTLTGSGDANNFAQAAKAVCDNAEEIFTGSVDAIDVLTQDSLLTRLYSSATFDYGELVRLLAGKEPTLRILEVGAGTGGTTDVVLRGLIPEEEGGLPYYSKYTFTDVSAGFFPNAKERFSKAPNMEYRVLDISDGLPPDFEVSSYDVIIAANVVHATPCLNKTLKNLNQLLRPGGMLILAELCTTMRSPGYIFGTFSGWWLGADDGRTNEPFVSPSRWHDELLASGFSGVDTIVKDDEAPYTSTATYLSRRIETKTRGNELSLLTIDSNSAVAVLLKDTLQSAGYNVTEVMFGEQSLPKHHDVLCCIDLEVDFLHDHLDEDRLKAFQTMIRELDEDQHLLWLTKPAQVKCADPRAAMTIGLARTIRTELGLSFCTLEIGPGESQLAELVAKVLGKIRRDEDRNTLASEKEYVVVDGQVCIGRYKPFKLEKDLAERSLSGCDTSLVLDVGQPGLISSLTWTKRAINSSTEVGVDDVVIRTLAVGLNLRDVLVAMGRIPQAVQARPELGLDFAGIVTACGSGVQDLSVGERVFAVTYRDSGLASRVVTDRRLVFKIPDKMSFAQAASIPTIFTTAITSLLKIARLERGQSVLIHSACGGVGMAAIQICRMVSTEIYATVGSKEKEDYLVEHFGIPRHRIFSSRHASFQDRLMTETDGYGVDVVLNSLSGELLHASWNCVAEFGIMVEIGKRDLLDHGQLDMNPFLANRRYACFDGFECARRRPQMIRDALECFLEGYARGELSSVSTITTFPAQDVIQAFRHLQNGNHIGKVAVTMDDVDTPSMMSLTVPSYKPICFNPEASYLLTGGLGGLGKATAVWLVEHGARSLTFLSRSAASPEVREFVEELSSMGCHVVCIAGQAENISDVRRAVASSKLPIKGIFHLAMVLKDAPFVNMSWSDWEQVTRPKVQGAWNLHNELLKAEHPLDFFWLASTNVSVMEQSGQGNYAAASTFLEAFCQYRRGLGLPASVLNICAIEGVGFVAGNAAAHRSLKARGIAFVREREYLDSVELAIHASTPDILVPGQQQQQQHHSPWRNDGQIIMGLRSELHLEDPQNRVPWRRDRKMGFYHNTELLQGSGEEAGGRNSSTLKQIIHRIVHGGEEGDEIEVRRQLAQEFGNKVMDLMMRPGGDEVDLSLGLLELGLDSLVATELRRWFRGVVGFTITVAEIMEAESVLTLANVAAERLRSTQSRV